MSLKPTLSRISESTCLLVFGPRNQCDFFASRYICTFWTPKIFAASRRFFQHEIDLCWRKVFQKAPQAIFFSFWTFKNRISFIKSIRFSKIAYAFSKISIEIPKNAYAFPENAYAFFGPGRDSGKYICKMHIYIWIKPHWFHYPAVAAPAAICSTVG